MTIIYLDEYKMPDRRKWYFALDPLSDKVAKRKTDQPQKEDWHNCGFATYQKVGLLPGSKRLFLALYAYNNKMYMRIGDQIYDCADDSLHVKRDGVAPFVKRFRVFRDKKVVSVFYYLYTDLLGTAYDETYGTDFPTFIELNITSRTNRNRFVYFWTEVSKGRDLRDPAFQNELDQIDKKSKFSTGLDQPNPLIK